MSKVDTESDTVRTNERIIKLDSDTTTSDTITTKNKGTYERRFTVYIPFNKKIVINKLKQVLNREGKTPSNFFIEKAEEYIQLHELGNPQQTIQRFMDGKQAYISADPCIFKCGRSSQFLASYGNDERRFKVCGVHADCIEHSSLKRNFRYKKWNIVGEIKP